jgi:eukaryotic-like serine/threonine-protein kinase
MRYCERCRASFQALRVCPRDQIETRADLSDPLLGELLGDRYRILERIAAGGAGQVYRAAHARIAALFAVKVLYGDLAADEGMRTRFRREAEVACALQSRHIVRVVDYGESPEGLAYLAMEYLDGISLSSLIARDGALPVKHALAIARQITRGLAHAHERGVVHRDLKTDNVMLVTEDNEEEVAKLLDFGLAHIRDDQRLTAQGQVFGTPHYMAPEQFKGTQVDARADLYALGVIMYEMLAGAPPFDAPTVLQLGHLHLTAEPRPLRDLRPEVPAKLAAGIHKLLAKDPNDRYQSANALLEGQTKPAARPAATRKQGVDRTLIHQITDAVLRSAPLYNAGDHAGCYRICRDVAEDLLRKALERDSTAVAARLGAALARSGEMDPTRASWELRYAFEDLLHAASAQAKAPKGEDPVMAELRVADAVAARRYQAGHLDIVGDYYFTFARQLAGRLQRTGQHPLVCARLERAVEHAAAEGGGQPALTGLSEALQALRRGHDESSRATIPLQPVSLHGCPRLADFARRIVRAIAVGTPAFNAGDAAACCRLFRQTASLVIVEVGADQGCSPVAARLQVALDESKKQTEEQAAWTLRRAFDDLLAAAKEGKRSVG